ncbi:MULTISPECIES: hypothetical protein [unclassified Arthrobacter]|uniref:hypothetical protein n=1 Tax=unclassified Arthrobacter TaxID=235627 RepID=UPI001F3A4E6C|nr:hypothetical protein [Arthrobacter sp. FW306-06-A]UKA72132.1 hypothetical protein LFT49_05220 [Arthrobacter sp. FW306-06-A]
MGVLQITDATGGFVRVRILVSAGDSAALFDLRCLVRETMVTFLQQNHPEALPHQRWEQAADRNPADDGGTGNRRRSPLRGLGSPAAAGSRAADPHESQLFTGSIEAVERSRAFSGPGEEVFEERDRNLASRN